MTYEKVLNRLKYTELCDFVTADLIVIIIVSMNIINNVIMDIGCCYISFFIVHLHLEYLVSFHSKAVVYSKLFN